MDESAKPHVPAGGIKINSTVLFGPLQIPGADADLLPLVGRLIAVVSAAATNLIQYAASEKDERGAARRLCGLAALCACGELRALAILCTSGLTMQARIHVRSVSECLKRIVVYYLDRAFALDTERTLDHFKADGFAKLDDAAQVRITKRDEETTRRYEQMMNDAKPPLLITKNPTYKGEIVGALDPFRQWAYGQVEHCTPIALAEISGRLSRTSENIYFTDEGVLLLIAAVGMGLVITGYLAGLGVATKDDFHEMQGRIAAVLKRSGLSAPGDETDGKT
jgi:hypothetical protein